MGNLFSDLLFFLPNLNFVTVRPGFSSIGTKAFFENLNFVLIKVQFSCNSYRNLIQLLKRPNICYIFFNSGGSKITNMTNTFVTKVMKVMSYGTFN